MHSPAPAPTPLNTYATRWACAVCRMMPACWAGSCKQGAQQERCKLSPVANSWHDSSSRRLRGGGLCPEGGEQQNCTAPAGCHTRAHQLY